MGAEPSPQVCNNQITSLLPPKLDPKTLATSLTYKLATYQSKVMQETRTYGVSLPPGYAQNPEQLYPVIFLLHGGHGDPETWFDPNKGRSLTTIQQLYALDKLPLSIIITPDGNDKRGTSPYWDPQYIDGANGKVSSALGDELVNLVKNRYRTLPDPNFWAIGGLSSGGWGAMNIGLHHLRYFSILFSHSGYFKDSSGPFNSPIAYIKFLPTQAQARLRIYLDSGESDPEEMQSAREFAQVLQRLNVAYLFNQFPGGHTWQYWREHLADSLSFVGEQFQAWDRIQTIATPELKCTDGKLKNQ
jgi:enterochelin esterase-like enzyme